MRILSLLFSLFLISCSSAHVICDLPHVEKTHYSTFEKVNSELEIKNKTVFLLFGADWCPACKKIKKLLKEDKSLHKALHLNIDETWAFVLSRKLGINQVPTLVVFKDGKLIEIIDDPNRILLKLIIQ